MLDKLGKRKFVLPLAVLLLIGCLFSLIFYPIANMEMKNLPFAIVCLDEGVETSEGDVNLGELVVKKITEQTATEGEDGSEASPIAWTQLASQEELDQALANNEYFGALVIPKDFSQRQYDTIVDTMQTKIDEMSSNMTDELGLPTGGLSGGLSLPGMGAGSASSASPQLSAEAQKMIAAAQGAFAGASKQAQGAAATFQQDQAAAVVAEQARAQAQTKLDEVQKALDEAKDQKATLESQLAALKANPAPTPDQQAQIDQLTTRIAQLDSTIATAEDQVSDAKATLDATAQAAQKAQQAAEASKNNLATAQANVKTAAANAQGVQKTAVASSALQTQASALMNAVGTLKDKLGSLAGNLDLSDRLSDMSETVAAKALVNAADTLENDTDEEDESTDSGAQILVFIDMAKSPMVANSMQSTMKLMFAEVGFQADILMIHDGTAEGATPETALEAANADGSDEEETVANPMSTMMSLQILMIPTVMLSLIIGLIITRLAKFAPGSTRKQRAQSLGKQLVLVLVFSGLVALTAYGMYALVVGGEGDFGSMVMFMWLVSFALMLAIGAMGNIALGLGILVAVCVIGFGMMTGVLPGQALPAFWQDWVYPWAPQHYFGDGIRAIMYMNTGWWNAQSPLFAAVALAGIVISLLAMLPPRKDRPSRLPF